MRRILVVDDHAVVRRGLRQILEASGHPAEIGEASTAAEALAATRGEAWDLVVLDLCLPDRSGLDVLREIRLERPALPVLILTVQAEGPMAIRVLKMGAAGYLTKESAPDELTVAVERALRGGRFVSPSLAEALADWVAGETDRPPHELLSDREFQVLALMVQGQSLTEIAKSLFISVKTVSTHRARILQKMHLRSNADLVQYALRYGLLPGSGPRHEPPQRG